MNEEKTLTLNINQDSSKLRFHRDRKLSVEIKRKRKGLTLDLDKSNKFVYKKSNTIVTKSKLTDMEFKARVKALQEALDKQELNGQNEKLINENNRAKFHDNSAATRIDDSVEENSSTLKTEHNVLQQSQDAETSSKGKLQSVENSTTHIDNPNNNNKNIKLNRPYNNEFSDKFNKRRNGESWINTTFNTTQLTESKIYRRQDQPSSITFNKNKIFRSEEFKKHKSEQNTDFRNRKTLSPNREYNKPPTGNTYKREMSTNKDFRPVKSNKFGKIDRPIDRKVESNSSGEYKNIVFKDDLFTKKPISSDKQYKNKANTKSNANKKSIKKHFEDDRKYSANKLKGINLDRALNDENEFRSRSLASVRRARSKLKNSEKADIKTKVVRDVAIPETISVGELANRMAVKAAEVIKYLISVGNMATINQSIDGDTAEIVCSHFGHNPKRATEKALLQELIFNQLDTADNLCVRAPIVAVMGHVDHGKTTLLDTLRKSGIAQKEAGGITQHVAAYQISTASGRKITFIDTPGHAAFNNIRNRGAKLTDIIILVVAADDGIKEQTVEVIKYAKLQKTPIIVAINKIDKDEINIEKVKMEFMQHDVLLEEFGGEVLSCEISAKNNINLDKLLDAILLQAEILDLKANPNRIANGIVLDTKIDKGQGIMAYVIVQGGKLHIGDILIAGTAYGKIKALTDSNGNRITEALPSDAISIIGFNSTPFPGDEFFVVSSEQRAKEIIAERLSVKEHNASAVVNSQLGNQSDKPILNIFLKADVFGSIEAIEASILAIDQSEVQLKLIGKDIGIISESDLDFVKKDKNTILIGFNVNTTTAAKELIKVHKLKIISSKVIYHVVEEIKEIMSLMLPPVIEEQYLGTADIKKLFVISRLGTVAGCYVSSGMIKRGNSKIKVIRNGKCLFEGEIKSMKHEKDEIKESKQGHECGILSSYNDYQVGDKIECYEIVEKKRKII